MRKKYDGAFHTPNAYVHSIELYALINSTCICHNIYKGRISETKTPAIRVRVMVFNATFNNMSDMS